MQQNKPKTVSINSNVLNTAGLNIFLDNIKTPVIKVAIELQCFQMFSTKFFSKRRHNRK